MPGPVFIAGNLYRLTAPNPGFMTGAGTNTYLLSCNGRFVVIDPGPAIPAHIDAILAFVGNPRAIEKIFVTHMHPDHSPAALPLANASGAAVYGGNPLLDEYQDLDCQPGHILHHDEVVSFGSATIRCIHTPGHVDNHFCFLYEEEGILMTGDHIMQGSTVVIIPPHGKMGDYLRSLQRLGNYAISRLAPGHGEIIADPAAEIRRLVNHRLNREAKVERILAGLGSATPSELLPLVYDDVSPQLHALASYSLLAHLIRLQEEGRAQLLGDRWQSKIFHAGLAE